MLRRVLPAALALLLGVDRALAGDEPVLPRPRGAQAPAAEADQGARWPAALQKRNARYASLTRVDDAEGDLHEALIAHTDLARVDDRLGDLEELRRKRAADHVPPRVVAHAVVTRDLDLASDAYEEVLASTTHERRHAETRRFRDLEGDRQELAAWREARRRSLIVDDRIYVAEDKEFSTRRNFIDQRDDIFSTDGSEPLRQIERSDEHESEQIEERQLADPFDRDIERSLDKDTEKAEAQIERALEDDDEALEEKTEKSAEQLEERLFERQAEAQAEREESGAP